MKLKDFLTLKVGSGIILSGNVYNPLINYDWSNTFQVANKMYSKNIGNSGQDLQLFSGQGFKSNGTNQYMSAGTFSELGVSGDKSVLTIACTTSVATSGVLWNTGYSSGYAGVSLQVSGGLISLNSNSTENTLLSTPYVAGQVVCTFNSNIWSIYINGILKTSRLFVYSAPFSLSASQVFSIGAYRLTAQYYNGIITDVYMFTDVLTADEIALYSANPNQFFQNVQDGIIDNCVLNMPLHGIDKYQVDYSRYALSTSIYTSSGLYNSSSSNTRIAQVTQGLLFEAGKTYSINYTFTDNVNIGGFSLYIPPSSNNGVATTISIARTSSNQDFIVRMPSTFTKLDGLTSAYFWLVVNGTATSTTFQNISIKEISGINEVVNYTADCVTLAKQLPYGSQEANFFHTSSGVPIRTGLSPFFESTPYWGNYGNTGYVSPLAISHETFELIIQRPRVIQSSFNKYLCGGNNSADLVVEISNNSDSMGFIRLRRVGVAFALNKWLNTNTMYIAMVCDGISVYIYINGLLVYTGIPQAYNSSYPIKLLGEHGGGNMIDNRCIRDAAVRLFKVHTKALTQEDITKNFNEYMAKGLLANFLLDENGNYIKDESNNYIMDI